MFDINFYMKTWQLNQRLQKGEVLEKDFVWAEYERHRNKAQHNYQTTIIITMLDLNQHDQAREFAKLKAAFAGLDVYIYLKSEDQQWYRQDYHGTNSIHWSEICKHPWMSITVKSDGMVAMQMKKQQTGSIIIFSSIYGLVGPNFAIYEGLGLTCPPAYPMIKGGIITMTKYFATYFGKDNIRVNCIAPGGIYNNHDPRFVAQYSEHVPLGRMGHADELTAATLFLASDDSSYMTGQSLTLDGGWTAW